MHKYALFAFVFISALFLIGCEKDKNDDYDAPTNLSVKKVAEDKLLITWEYNTSNGTYDFTLARKLGEAAWVDDYYSSEDDTKEYVDEVSTSSANVIAYKVKGHDSDEGTITAYSEPVAYFSPATTPTDLVIEQTGENKVTLTWTDNAVGEAGYKIDRKLEGADWVSEYKKLAENDTTFTDSVAFAVPVEYRVYAYMGISNSVSVDGDINPSFPAPYSLTASQLSRETVRLNWDASSDDQEGFLIERRIGIADETNDWAQIAVVNDTSGVYTDNLDQNAATIFYRIRAYSHLNGDETAEIIHSAYSDIVSLDFNIALLGENAISDTGNDVWVTQNYAFVAQNFAGVGFYNVANEANPAYLGNLPTSGRVMSVCVQGSLLMVGHTNGGVDFYNVNDPATPVFVGNCETIDIPYDLAYATINGHPYLYVADGEAGLLTIDLDGSNPLNPQVVSRLNTNGIAYGLLIDGTTLYLADGTDGVLAYNLSTPASPSLLRRSQAIGEVHSLSLHNGTLYAAAGENGIVCLSPSSLTVDDTHDTKGFTRSVVWSQNRLYAADDSNGLLIYDPESNHIMAQIDTGSNVRALVRVNNMAYVVSETSFRIIQVNP
jgi:hypothetical protein